MYDWEAIGHAYNQANIVDANALDAWQTLADECMDWADYLRTQLDVEVVDRQEPYIQAREMFHDIRVDGHLYISRANCVHPHWTDKENIAFRIVHDVLGHFMSRGAFTWKGEVKAYTRQATYHSPQAQRALFTEVIGQTAAYKVGGNRTQKCTLLTEVLANTGAKDAAST